MVRRGSLEPYLFDTVTYYEHQIEGIRELAKRKSFLLADDMGLGKSLQALTIFIVDVKRGWAETCLVVCPVTLKGNWADEIDKFTTLPHITLDGSPAQRRELIKKYQGMTGPRILICNYEQVSAHFADLRACRFDVAIYDEAHYLKNPKAKRTKACIDLYSNRKFLLTGTPMLNQVNELWSLLHMIEPAAFPKYWRFVQRYCVFGGWQGKQIVGVKNEKELTEHLQAVMLRRLKKDVLDLPEVQIIERRVDLHPEQRDIYDKLNEDMKMPDIAGMSGKDIENALVRFLRLKQVCGTTMGEFSSKDISSKMDLASDDDEEIVKNGHKVVVFTQFRQVLACYKSRLNKLHIPTWELHGDVKQPDRQPVVRDWTNATEPGVLICMLQVAREGLNLVAARHGNFLDELFVPGLNQQAIDRMHRIGADVTQPVQIRKYIARNTIENRIQQILRLKKNLNKQIVESDPEWKRKLYEALIGKDD